jgi:EpsI family protein
MPLPRNRAALAVSALLILQGAGFYAVASRPELVAPMAPLVAFPTSFGSWEMQEDNPIEPEVLDVLKADDTLNRRYANRATGSQVMLFIAYFKTQRQGASPHSPKNCLPGAGWEPVESPSRVKITVPGRAEPLESNRFIVARGEQKSVVLYWYQSHNRTIASEYAAKCWLILDAIRYRRSDTALVKAVVPFSGPDQEAAVKTGVSFVEAAFPYVVKQLPE